MNTPTPPNLILIGMPGSGKTTLGLRLARELERPFLDTDAVIEQQEGRSLQAILDQDGPEALRRAEESVLVDLRCQGAVIATGGSAVYSQSGMEALGRQGIRIFLDVPCATLRQRVGHGAGRGLLMRPGQTFDTLLEERLPLYRRYADITVNCGDGPEAASHAALIQALRANDLL